ncbi:hypothetical protein ACKFR5_02970 [Corynebacterium marquesiae]|uniref:hypothetical protein n=1 Tax=Corynebacterium marquesiae TaxID=2913503 RepID=UPI0038CFED4F
MTPLEARKHLAQADAGGRVSQDVAIAALEDVAGLRYEYAAQIWRPLIGKWLFPGSLGLWEKPHRARWYALASTAERMATEKYPGKWVRVVARVYGQPMPVGEPA